MFRKCIDLATKNLLEQAFSSGASPSKRVAYFLKDRLEYLFESGKLPSDLHKLADSIREDGNDGAHSTASKLDESDLEYLSDFAIRLLDRLISEPERVRLAELRRAERRK